ncbi:4Fe-4S binding protein [Methanobacterium sp. ACI-7]|uniref:4Fe-4S binding protein n=1 Tax=unclassified Methanobacterium TaxID=2627676 RepID=UPI0039C4270E
MENKGCGFKEGDKFKKENNDCGCGCEDIENNIGMPEEDACGCGCDEYPDTSLIENPDKPEFIASSNYLEEFEKYAHSLGVKSIGYTQLTPELLIKDKFIQYSPTIVLTMELDKRITETEPGKEAYRLNSSFYREFGEITYKLSDYLRKNGFATEVAHPFEGNVNYSLLGQYAGLGYIGKDGLLITPELGPRQKISAIFVSIVNLPLKDKEDNEHSWIPNYCDKCGKCVKACPESALIERKTCFGGKEIEFKPNQCIGCVQGCAYCIRACPFDEKGYDYVKARFDKMNAKLMEKKKQKCC